MPCIIWHYNGLLNIYNDDNKSGGVLVQSLNIITKDFVIIQNYRYAFIHPFGEFVGMQPEQSFRAVIDLMHNNIHRLI